ncbi:uncharacterized protein G2W53_011947 [Senna tora]|uniref:Uncharacterized protein n=1 Tax=Senna tora TaxID=362788 RepID=A0A834TX77_9FABA|nr:uncharacterized protein G2W53_011947 [Senna tora]
MDINGPIMVVVKPIMENLQAQRK